MAHYLDNHAFLKALIEYRRQCARAKRRGRSAPQIPEYIGECLLLIATHLSYKPNFIKYTYRDDMIADGVENCIQYMHRFNPRKSRNPFGYFTSIIFYAFLRRIQKERKQTYIRYKLIEQAITVGDAIPSPDSSNSFHVDAELLSYDNVQEFIRRYDEYTDRRRQQRRVPKATPLP